MPIIEVTLLEGRTPEAKEALVAAPIESVRVILREVPAAHFAVGGQSFAARRARESGG